MNFFPFPSASRLEKNRDKNPPWWIIALIIIFFIINIYYYCNR